jgi:hypothetical protein
VTNLALFLEKIISFPCIRLVVALDSASISHEIAFLKLDRAQATSWLDAMGQLNWSSGARTSNHPHASVVRRQSCFNFRRGVDRSPRWRRTRGGLASRMERGPGGATGYADDGGLETGTRGGPAPWLRACGRPATNPFSCRRTPGFVLLPRP